MEEKSIIASSMTKIYENYFGILFLDELKTAKISTD